MLKLASGQYKGYPFLFQYETATELKLLILQFQNTVDFVFCEVFELSLGWGDVRKSVFCIEREKILDETKDEFVWKTISV